MNRPKRSLTSAKIDYSATWWDSPNSDENSSFDTPQCKATDDTQSIHTNNLLSEEKEDISYDIEKGSRRTKMPYKRGRELVENNVSSKYVKAQSIVGGDSKRREERKAIPHLVDSDLISHAQGVRLPDGEPCQYSISCKEPL